ncbi:MAG: ABC transporter ATP-binding protein [Rhodobacteraceae bacterium]|nr:ABC transporter ATP-binding protein [Paracoccaceae bacterium]
MKIFNLINAFQPASGPPPKTMFAFFCWALSGSWLMLSVAFMISALAGILEVFTALLLGSLIDKAISAGPTDFFYNHLVYIIGFVAFFIVIRPLAFGMSSAANAIFVTPNINPLTLSRLHRWTMGQAVTFFDEDFAGRIAQKQMQTSRALTDVVTEIVNVGAFSLASLVGSVLLLVTIDLRMSGVLIVWLILYLLLIKAFLPKVRRQSAERAGARANVSGQVVDTITNIKTVKLFSHAEHEDHVALKSMEIFRRKAISFGITSAVFRLCLMTIAGILPVALIGGTVFLWSNGNASIGEITASGAVAIRIAQMTGWVSFTLMTIYANIGEVEDGIRTLSPPHTLVNKKDAEPLKVKNGEIVIQNISFTYGQKASGLHNLSLTIKKGEKLGVVGASGAGKSTLVALLLRLYDTELGTISIDGQNIKKVTQESLRRNIGFVTQETAMFNRSARDNILYGRPNATELELLRASKDAEAHEFITELMDHSGRTSYDAHLGERGVRLSGGQRQRIAVARAILKDAPILILDEATSALDSEIEASIQLALQRAMKHKTVIAIAHRLSTIVNMDRIIVLKKGKIAEAGTHIELLKKRGLYYMYWERQSGGFIGVNPKNLSNQR